MKSSWIILLFLILFVSMETDASEVSTQVKEINISEKVYEPTLVFLANGQVAKLDPDKQELLEQLLAAQHDLNWLKITLSDKREIEQIKFLDTSVNESVSKVPGFIKTVNDDEPTVLSSINLARTYFRYARMKNKESQCFNRAHVWSYEWKTDKNINSAKMFIFFSVKYIREHDFHWWFHVAPYVHVVIGTEIKERIMDKKYTAGPSTLREWIDTLIEDGTQCRTIKLFSEYANYPESGDCYLMRTSMYTYWPLDIEMEELKGTMKQSWVPSEVQQAYTEAFDVTISAGDLHE